MAEAETVKTGLVGFFDILGYQNIIDNNEIQRVSALISGTLNKLPEKVRQNMVESASEDKKRLVEKYATRITTRLISDTILLSRPIDIEDQEDDERKAVITAFFLHYSFKLAREMFNEGLPVRAAIDFGEFYIDGDCFAGKPIVDCYRLAQQLELSGVVLTKTFGDVYIAKWKHYAWGKSSVGRACLDYLVPVKGGNPERLFILDWWDHKQSDADIRQAVFEAFGGHNKDVPESVYPKLRNTELSIRAFIQNRKMLSPKKS